MITKHCISPSGASRATAAALLVLVASLPATDSSAANNGRWTNPQDWSGGDPKKYAIDLLLLPGDGSPYHSRVLYFSGEHTGALEGKEYGWIPANSDCSSPVSNPGFTDLGAPSGAAGYDLYCGGHTQLADGSVLLPGGTLPGGGYFGEHKSARFNLGSDTTAGSWSPISQPMQDGRWYPSSVFLRDGRALVIAGHRYPQVRVFGGRRSGNAPASPEGDRLLRFGPEEPAGNWDPSVTPDADGPNGRPVPRERFTGIEMEDASYFEGHTYFGGLRANGLPLNDTWILHRQPGLAQADYKYQWQMLNPGGNLPPTRSDHSAVMAMGAVMVVFGGRGSTGDPVPAVVYRLFPDPILAWQWSQMQVSGAAPSARYGHAAVYDEQVIAGTLRKRMIVFGGVAGDNQSPTDTKVYELRFDPSDPNKATWYEHTPVAVDTSGTPTARYWHTMSTDKNAHLYAANQNEHAALMFGGKLGASSYSNELWVLWMFADGTFGWQKRSYSGEPSARALHSAAYGGADGGGPRKRLYVNGGVLGSGGGDAATYMLDPWGPDPPVWHSWASAEAPLSGHTAVFDSYHSASYIHSRVAEVFNPANSQYFTDTNARLFQYYYPPSFTIPGRDVEGGRVLSIAQNCSTYVLDVRPQGTLSDGWSRLANGYLGFLPVSAVIYKRLEDAAPQILAVGSNSDPIVGTTKTLSLSGLDIAWVDAGTIIPRRYCNLVVLPGGRSLVLGGLTTGATSSTDTSKAVYRPQMWNPATRTWTGPNESDPDRIPSHQVVRNLHSTAVLLPDGRVLSMGGESGEGQPTRKQYAEVFCPSYLFQADGTTPATRPPVTGATAGVVLGDTFTVCMSNTAGVQKVCLIRPGATTHGFDQNQRYMELSFSIQSNPSRLLVYAPPTADVAPPGYYLLFVVGSDTNNGGTAETPSIARWVQITSPGGFDACDLTRPGWMSSLAVEWVSQTQAGLTWEATADDSTIAASGMETSFDVRHSTVAINSEATWSYAGQTSGEPTPGGLGTFHEMTIGGLQACTWYNFANRATDDNANLSLIQPQVRARTSCSSGGGGESAVSTDGRVDAIGAGRAASPAPDAAAAMAEPLVVTTTKVAAGGWTVTVSRASEKAPAGAEVAVEKPDPSGVWLKTGAFTGPQGASEFALTHLVDGRRLVLPGQWEVSLAAASLTHEGTNYRLTRASHSRLGALTVTSAGVAGPVLDPGDAITLDYALDSQGEAGDVGYLSLRRAAIGTALRGDRSPSADLPVSFALRQNAPNPFRTTTVVRFDLPARSNVSLVVFDLTGRRVRTLASGVLEAGTHSLEWDHRDDQGRAVHPGLYASRLIAGAFRAERKMMLTP